MNITLRSTAAVCAFIAMAGAASADCGIKAGHVNIIGNEFPAIQTIAAAAAECANDGVTIEANLTADHQKLNVAGMTGNPAEYTSAIVASSSIVELINEDVVRPLDDLVAEFGADIPKHQRITIDGKIMAIAFMANAQTLAYRADVLERVGLGVPTSYEEVLVAAEAIRSAGIMDNPVGGAYAAGWNLAQEFNNMYLGHGGAFFEPGTANVSINNPQGVATLEMMKALTKYMNPDYLTHDSNGTQSEWEAGNVALMSMWGSRMQNIMDDEGSEPQNYENTKVSGPLMVGDSGVPASTLWWDGWTVAKNLSDEDAAATFRALAHGVSSHILTDETMDQAVWLIDGYKAAPVSEGVLAAVKAGTKPYPMLPYMGLLQTAAGDNIADFLTDKESAEQTLSDIEAAYNAAAREKGYIH